MKVKNKVSLQPLLQVEELEVHYRAGRKPPVQAVSGISFSIFPGETFGLVGESGCGKSSVARAVMQLPRPTAGRVVLNGTDLTRTDRSRLRRLRLQLQMVFQDPIASLNPRRRIAKSVAVPLTEMTNLGRKECRSRVEQILTAVGLDPQQYGERFPFQLSGGQCQRVSIARALICRPQLLVCDEPVSSLDVSVQAQIINLLRDLKSSYGLSMLFISHDLAVVKNICDRVAVMYLGRLCEIAPAETLYRQPLHPYTRALLSAVPRLDRRERSPQIDLLPGELPSASAPPNGCRFRSRCPRAQVECGLLAPGLREFGGGHMVACHNPMLAESPAEADCSINPEFRTQVQL